MKNQDTQWEMKKTDLENKKNLANFRKFLIAFLCCHTGFF